jgi:Holliday junction resolvase
LKAEAEIQDEIIKYLRLRGFVVIRMNSGAVKTEGRYIVNYRIIPSGAASGLSDIIATKGERTIYIEVKTASGTMTNSQRNFKSLLDSVGTPYVLARSVQDVHKYLVTGILPPIPKKREKSKERQAKEQTDLLRKIRGEE